MEREVDGHCSGSGSSNRSPNGGAGLALPKTLADYLANPVAQTEWVDGCIVEKVGQTLGHAKIQTRLLIRWAGYVEHQQLGGMVLVEAPCQTTGKVRRPDVAYLSPDLIQQFGEDIATLLQSYPLVEEIFSPTDCGEDIFLKAQEYLSSDVLEVWLIFPRSKYVFIQTQDGHLWLAEQDTDKS
ncbi:Uma2 family endonuclease [Thermostichus sp. OS-CIW-26]